jgi:hypothetical protein
VQRIFTLTRRLLTKRTIGVFMVIVAVIDGLDIAR